MEDRGRLIYEEEIRESRIQAELNGHHIGMMGCAMAILLTWSLYGWRIWLGVGFPWRGLGGIIAVILTVVFIMIMNKLYALEFTQNLPIKIYEKGILMPITPMDAALRRKRSFIHDNDLASLSLVRAHRPDKKDILYAVTKQKRVYTKRYDRNSDIPEDIMDAVRISAPQAKISFSE
jgi:hypothetical protein